MSAAPLHNNRVVERLGLMALLAGTALLFTWHLDRSGFANEYYSAAAQAGSSSWKAMLFGSLDAGNGITVDKPPLGLWPIALSVKTFGLSSWSILLPQAAMGVATVAILYHVVRRVTGSAAAGLVAGLVLAVTPVATLMFRYNNPDALLTLLIVAVAATTLRALSGPHSAAWMTATGALIGAAFLTKLGQAFLVVPALAITYLIYAQAPMVKRIGHLLLCATTALVTGGWWILLVAIWPAGSRPWIGSTANNSAWQVALGYNGIGRLTGNETSATGLSSGWHANNLQRMFGPEVGAEVMWLVPAAALLGMGGFWVARHTSRRDTIRAAIVMWLIWLMTVLVILSAMAGIFHSYYTIMLVPSVAGLVAIGGHTLWHSRDRAWVTPLLVVTSIGTTLLAFRLAAVQPWRPAWLFPVIAVIGAWAVLSLLQPSGTRRVAQWVIVTSVVAALVAPTTYSMATTQVAHSGPSPMAGHRPDRPNKTVPSEVVALVGHDASQYRWAAAIPKAQGAAAYELQSGVPVLAMGGYRGSDPFPTIAELASLVAHHQIHYVLDVHHSGHTKDVMTWVRHHFVSTTLSGVAVYDMTRATT